MKLEFPTRLLRRLFMSNIAVFVTYGKFLIIEGKLQNQENVISVEADSVRLWKLVPLTFVPTISISFPQPD